MRLLILLLATVTLTALTTACAQNPPRGPAAAETAASARTALAASISAYESGDAARVISQLDPGMLGYADYADGIRRDTAQFKQIRVQLLDTSVTSGGSIVYVSSAWEKRVLTANTLKPQLHKGRSTFAMKQAADGWRISAIAGDNLFSTPVVTLP